MGASNIMGVGATPSHSITMKTAMSEKRKFTSENRTFSMGNTDFLTRTFLSRGAASMIDIMPALVESEKTCQVILATMR